MSLLLAQQGCEVSGYSLDPRPDALFVRADLEGLFSHDVRADVRDAAHLKAAIRDVEPHVLIHMAAQPLVRYSYQAPRETFETNVNGTLNVLEACSASDALEACLIVTTDKVYRNDGRSHGYTENDPLGGRDPYSASKSMADLLVQCWHASFLGLPLAVVRAGNVIGGGDDSQDRLVPDVLRALSNGEVPALRHPTAVRPWQHVMDCLNGYQFVINHLLAQGGSPESFLAFNIGPDPGNLASVSDVVALVHQSWGLPDSLTTSQPSGVKEDSHLTLDAALARTTLGWEDILSLEEAVGWTVSWHQQVASGRSARQVTEAQINEFLKLSGI